MAKSHTQSQVITDGLKLNRARYKASTGDYKNSRIPWILDYPPSPKCRNFMDGLKPVPFK